LVANRVAIAGNTWDGGAGSDHSWSNPLNWNGDSLPDGAGTLSFPIPVQTVQNLYTSPSPPPIAYSGIDFTGGADIVDAPSPAAKGILHLAAGAVINARGGSSAIDTTFRPTGSLTLNAGTNRSIFFWQPLAESSPTDVVIGSGPGDNGNVFLPFFLGPNTPAATYTGTTTLNYGGLALAALGLRSYTVNQGDYTIAAG